MVQQTSKDTVQENKPFAFQLYSRVVVSVCLGNMGGLGQFVPTVFDLIHFGIRFQYCLVGE